MAGDFDPAEARRLIERYFGPIPSGPEVEPIPPRVPELEAPVGLAMTDRVSLPRAYLVWPTVPRGHPDEAALDVLGAVLGLLEKENRLEKALIYDESLASQVFAYHGRNYLLPVHAPRLTGQAPRTQRSRGDSNPDDAGPGAAPAGDDSGRAALEQLDRAVGAVALSPRSDAANGGDPARAAEEDEGAAGDGLPQEGQMLLWRRGRLARQDSGAWSFVFDAGAGGRQDMPLTVMPCLLLERMEQHVTAGAPGAAMLVSGRVYRYGPKAYLLPTAFEVPRQRTILSP